MEDMEGQGQVPAFVPNDEIAQALEIASELCLVEDPVEEPYRSKYKARETLKKAKRSVETNNATSSKSVALIDYQLGVIALAVEENSAAQESLEKAADVFFKGVVGRVTEAASNEEDNLTGGEKMGEQITAGSGVGPDNEKSGVPTEAAPGMATPSALAWDHPAEAADTLMQLGILWSSRGYPRRSLLYLLASVSFLRETSSAEPIPNAESPIENANGSTRSASVNPLATVASTKVDGSVGVAQESPSEDESAGAKNQNRRALGRCEKETRRSKLESLLTHAYYYLGQAYGTKDVGKMAKYCALTLQRQLEAAQRGQGDDVSFNPGEWSRNACFLADYYARLKLYPVAGRCLVAAQAVLAGQTGGSGKCERGVRSDVRAAGNIIPRLQERRDASQSVDAAEPSDEVKAEVGVHVAETETRSGTDRTCEGAKGEQTASPRLDPVDRADSAKVFLSPPPGPTTTPTPSEPTPAEDGSSTNARGNKREVSGNAREAGSGEEGRETEQRREQRADVHRHIAKLYIAALEAKHRERGLLGTGVDLEEVRSAQREERKRAGDATDGLDFERLRFGDLPVCDPLAMEDTFESVRNVFKKAKSHTEKALQHYVLDGFVSTHVALHQGMSRAYLYLSTFEEDAKRRQAMYSRRAQALKPLLLCLGRKAYAHLHKELSFELGEIYQDLSDLKFARMQEKSARGEGPVECGAVNKLVQSAIGFYSHFIGLYHGTDHVRGGAPDSPLPPEKGMEDEEVPGYLHARFARARLHGKLQFSTSEQAVRALRLSCLDFAWLVENARGYLSSALEKDPTVFQTELELAEEMMQLQRRNIANLERK